MQTIASRGDAMRNPYKFQSSDHPGGAKGPLPRGRMMLYQVRADGAAEGAHGGGGGGAGGGPSVLAVPAAEAEALAARLGVAYVADDGGDALAPTHPLVALLVREARSS